MCSSDLKVSTSVLPHHALLIKERYQKLLTHYCTAMQSECHNGELSSSARSSDRHALGFFFFPFPFLFYLEEKYMLGNVMLKKIRCTHIYTHSERERESMNDSTI